MKNLENYGVQTLDTREIREIDGGLIWCNIFMCPCSWPGGIVIHLEKLLDNLN